MTLCSVGQRNVGRNSVGQRNTTWCNSVALIVLDRPHLEGEGGHLPVFVGVGHVSSGRSSVAGGTADLQSDQQNN